MSTPFNLQRIQLRDQQKVIERQTRLQEREQANQVNVSMRGIDGAQAKVLPEDKGELVHMAVVANGSNRPIREVSAKIEVIRRDGARFDKMADTYGEVVAFGLGAGAEAETFVFQQHASTMPVLVSNRKAAFVWPFTAPDHPNLLSWVRFTDDAGLHWEIDTSLHLTRLDNRDW
jgi:hypothetical protein